MKKLLITAKLAEEGVEALKKHFEVTIKTGMSQTELKEIIPNFEVVLIRSDAQINQEILDVAEKLEVVGRAGAGLDNVDLEYAKTKGVKVFNTPNANSNAVAELVFGLMLTLQRNIREADISMKNNEWIKPQLLGGELSGKKLGIIGLGHIGQIVAHLAHAFGMNVVGFDPYANKEKVETLGIKKIEDLNEFLEESDILTLHIPKTKETTYFLGENEFNQMKDGTILINCSRGGIVKEDALLNALQNGKIAAAAVDVWEQEPDANAELKALPNVLALPHIGASTREAQMRCVFDLIESVFDFYEYK